MKIGDRFKDDTYEYMITKTTPNGNFVVRRTAIVASTRNAPPVEMTKTELAELEKVGG
jgi:hypothetical protein